MRNTIKTDLTEFHSIPGFEGYLINEKAQVYSLLTDRIIKSYKAKSGYITIKLRNEGKSYTKKVHRLMAHTFLGLGTSNKAIHVNHIDFNPGNNTLSNLELVTARQNVSHSINAGRWSYRTNNQERTESIIFLKLVGLGVKQIMVATGFTKGQVESCYYQRCPKYKAA